MTDTELAQLIDRRRDLAAQLAGVELEIAMAVGDRDAARRHLHEMNAQTEARKAARFAMCRAMGAH
ncbi:neutral zinc metalloprotease [Acidovorax sp. BL-A-41-H1]|uniref:neutral zinc metalloprotease n=1 Tax=Acidovorax sp. BL-A-41-H1 TaxID=3421102 RepID=UPI003F7A2836